jgi:hypothetical protein
MLIGLAMPPDWLEQTIMPTKAMETTSDYRWNIGGNALMVLMENKGTSKNYFDSSLNLPI